MHGLINRAIQCFLTQTHGRALWADVVHRAAIGQIVDDDGFETMRHYDDAVTWAVIDAALATLKLPRDTMLEDLGTFLVSHEGLGAVRRLLRFGGVTFTDFLFSLEDLQGRSHLAVQDLGLPDLWLETASDGHFRIACRGCVDGFGHVVVGMLRALADDYGALAVLHHRGRTNDTATEIIEIEVYDPSHTDGKRFDLAVGLG